jgi:hypothetical protein
MLNRLNNKTERQNIMATKSNTKSQMSLEDIEKQIAELTEQRNQQLREQIEPLKIEISEGFDALLVKVQQVLAIEPDYLPKWASVRIDVAVSKWLMTQEGKTATLEQIVAAHPSFDAGKLRKMMEKNSQGDNARFSHNPKTKTFTLVE